MHALGNGRVLVHPTMRRPGRAAHPAIGAALRGLAAAALAIDAYVHITSAGVYDPAHGGLITEGNLFRVEAVVAVLTAVAVLVRGTPRVWLLAAVVAASALGAVLLYRYVDVGALGPIPNLYEPTWQVPGKLASAYAEGAALILAAAAVLRTRRVRPAQGPRR